MFVDALNEQQPGKVNLFEMQQKIIQFFARLRLPCSSKKPRRQ
jgi:hypothetical protein